MGSSYLQHNYFITKLLKMKQMNTTKTKLWTALVVMTAVTVVAFTSCKKSTAPTPAAPTMQKLTIDGTAKDYKATLTFSEGVYKYKNKTGALDNSNFNVTMKGGAASIVSFTVSHTAGSNTATLNLKFSDYPDGKETLSIKPASDIYNGAGVALSATQTKEVKVNAAGHKVITIKDSGNGIGTQTWTANNTYLLDGFCFVNKGQTLTIEPGTVIKGKPGQGVNASALIIARGGKIMAEGTKSKPIIFTAEADDLNGSVGDMDDGLWGGVIILGKARLNTVPKEQQIEGIPQTEPRGVYGGDDDADNSGIIKYVSIRHGGTDIGAGNEINGLTLGGVGSGTVIDYIEVIANKDDGIEFFGGDPRVKHFVSVFNGDDSFDYDQGFRGFGQFWLAVQGFQRGDRLGEHDGGTQPETGRPLATPTIYNVTYIGQGDAAGKRTITFRDNAGGTYANSIFFNQHYGIDIEYLSSECSWTRFQKDDLHVLNNVFYQIGDTMPLFVKAYAGVTSAQIKAANDSLANYFAQVGNMVADPGLSIANNKWGIIPNKHVSDNLASYPASSWFDKVNYRGAVDPNNNWVDGWTLFSKHYMKK
jgi:hypothetical protein